MTTQARRGLPVLLVLALLAGSCQSGPSRIDSGPTGGPSGDDAAGDDATGDDAAADDTGDGPWQSECLSKSNPPDGWTETVSLAWDGADLRVDHGLTCRNCGFRLDVWVSWGEREVTVLEYNDPRDPEAGCDCLFDFAYDAGAVPPGSYTFILQVDDFGGGATTWIERDVALPAGAPIVYDFAIPRSGICL